MKKTFSQIKEKYIKLVGKAIEEVLPEAVIIFYGSLISEDFSPRLSDIDVAIYLGRPLSGKEYLQLLKKFEELSILKEIDLVDLTTIKDFKFLQEIVERGLIWKGSKENLKNLLKPIKNSKR